MKVLVAHESAMYRSLLYDGLAELAEVGQPQFAHDLDSTKTVTEEFEPDLIIADANLPGLDADRPSRSLQSQHRRVSIVLLVDDEEQSQQVRQSDSSQAIVHVVIKPWTSDRTVTVAALAEGLRASIKRLAGRPTSNTARARIGLFVIGASTGGPVALLDVVAGLPADFPAPIFVAQHMPLGFVAPLVEEMDKRANVTVCVAEQGQTVGPGMIAVAPADRHLTITSITDSTARTGLNQDPPVHGCRPALDPLALSAAKAYGKRAALIILTGIGHDGTAGAAAIVKAGGLVMAQSQDSSSVYGMPKSVADAGLVDSVVHLTKIPETMRTWAGRS